MAYFPLFFEMEGKRVLIVGAGAVAERRIRTLLGFGACLEVVAKEATPQVMQWGTEGRIRLILSAYEDYRRQEGAHYHWESPPFLLLTATGREETDALAARDGREQGCFVNVAGKKEESDFYFPAIAQAGSLTAGLIAGGTDHRLVRETAARLRPFLKSCAEEKPGE